MIDLANLPEDFLTANNPSSSDEHSSETAEQIPQTLIEPEQENEEEEEEEEDNPLDSFRCAAGETTMMPKIPFTIDAEAASIAPGENKEPIAIFTDKYCEEMAFPLLFPTGKFAFKVERVVPITISRYFNQRLLNYTQKFASDSDYIFFANHASQEIKMYNKIKIAMKKVSGGNLTAGMFTNNFRATVSSFVANDQAFSFMNDVKGTPAYWKRFLNEVLAMVKQLGIPSFLLNIVVVLTLGGKNYLLSFLNCIDSI